MTTREQVLGHNLSDVFPDNPADPGALQPVLAETPPA